MAAASLVACAACNALLDTPPPTAMKGDGDAGDSPDVGAALPPAARDSGIDSGVSPPSVPAEASAPSDAPSDAVDAAPMCNGAPVDLSTDSANCGSCGHSCQQGSCGGGKCEAYVVAGSPYSYRGLKSLYGLALIGDTLYGTDWYQPFTEIYATSTQQSVTQPAPIYPLPGSDAGADGAADAMTTDGTTIFFSTYRTETAYPGGIWALDPVSGSVQQLASTAGVSSMTAAVGRVFWADESGSIFSSAKDGTAQISAACGRDAGTPILAANGSLYYVRGNSLVATDPSNLGTVLATYSGSTGVSRFGVDAASAYWFDGGGKRLYRSALADNPPTPVDITPPGLATAGPLFTMLVDDASVYFASYDINVHATVTRVKKDGSSSDVMLDIADGIGAWTQDTKTLYFTTYGNDSAGNPPYSAVWKLAK